MWLGAVALVLVGAKLVLIDTYGSDLPVSDQWDAEGANLYLPYLAHGLDGIAWLEPHNNHRILSTRAMALALFVANGQWDAQVQTVANIVLHVLCALILARIALRFPVSAPLRMGLVALVVVGFASPYAWENTLGGFASPFYFLLLATLPLLCIAAKAEPNAWDCTLALVLGVLAFFSMAGGAFSCLAAASCLLLRQWTDPLVAGRRIRWSLIASLLALTVIEIAFTPRERPAGFTGQTPQGFVVALHHILSFPTRAGAIAIWSPFVALLASCWIGRREAAPPAAVFLVVGLGVFVLLTAAGIAMQRGDSLASRYADILWLAHLVNLSALYWILTRGTRASGWRRTVAVVCSLTLMGILLSDGFGALDQALERHQALEAGVKSVREFVRTGNPSALGDQPPGDIPYPSADRLQELLSDPSLKRVLPPSVRSGLLETTGRIESTNLASPGTDRSGIDRSARPSLGTFGVADAPPHLRSALLHAETRYLAIDMTGNGPASASLSLVTEGGIETRIRLPTGFPHDGWTRIVFDAPSDPFRLVVRQDAGDTRWVAFRGPIEIGRLRRIADRLLRQAWTILAFGLAALLVAIIFAGPTDEAVSSRRAH